MTGASLEVISACCRRLKHLHLQGVYLGTSVSLAPLPKLELLNLSHCGDVSDELIQQFMEQSPCLTELTLVSCYSVTDKSLQSVLAASNLRHLHAAGMAWHGDLLAETVSTSAHPSGYPYPDIDQSSQHPSLESASDDGLVALPVTTSCKLESLILRRSRSMTLQGIQAIIRGVSGSLMSVDVCGLVAVNDAAITMLCRHNPSLTTLLLCGTSVTTDSIVHMCNHSRIHHFDVTDCDGVDVVAALDSIRAASTSNSALQACWLGGGRQQYTASRLFAISEQLHTMSAFHIKVYVTEPGSARTGTSDCAAFGRWSTLRSSTGSAMH